MAKIIYQNTHVDENYQTGEVTRQVTENVVRFPREPEYVKMYVDDLSSILNLGKGASKLLCALVRKLDYDGLISLPAYTRKQIAKELDMTDATLKNRITDLVKKDVLKRMGKSVYEINPNYFARGDWKDIYKRRQNFRMQVDYTSDGKRKITGKAI